MRRVIGTTWADPTGKGNAVNKPPGGWTPFLVREGVVDGELLDGPHEGVPDRLHPSLWGWVKPYLFQKTAGGRVVWTNWAFIRWFERTSGFAFDLPGGSGEGKAFDVVDVHCERNASVHLAIVDSLLATRTVTRGEDVDALDQMLHEAGSVWRVDVGREPPALVRRVSETLEAAVLKEAQRGEASGELLALAWRSAFGQNPNASEAYRHAVRAVEAAAGPIVLPRDSDRTFGKMVSHLRDAEASWRFTLKGRRTRPNRCARSAR